MLIESLQVRNFRNLNRIDTTFSSGINVIHGLNAQGKTNLLEAVYLLVTGRSFRTTNDSELVPWERSEYEGTLIRATVRKSSGTEQLAVFLNGREKRVLIDGKPISRLAHLIGRLNAVLFTPSDLLLVRGAPALRRRFLDIAIGQTSAAYIDSLQTYQQVLKNRNALLKRAGAQPRGMDVHLDVYDQQLASSGALVMKARHAAVEEIGLYASKHYSTISNAREPMKLEYEPDVSCDNMQDELGLQNHLLETLRKSRADDLRRLSTLRGPHRDDFQFVVQDYSARHYASQGQQRTAVLAVKLAEMDYLRDHTGETPLLMLDDLMSELDDERKQALLRHLNSQTQIFVTATDPNLVTEFTQAEMLLKIDGGALSS